MSHLKRLSRSDPAAGEAAQLGEQLRDARIALGLSIEDVAASLRIRRVYLVALEEGRVRELPAPAYVLGFVRTYARMLGLDDDDMVRRFRDDAAAAPQRGADLIFPEPVPERGIPAGVVVMAGVVLMIGAYMAWFQWSGSGARTVDTVPPMPARLEQAAREAPPVVGANLPPAAGTLIAGAMPPIGQRPAMPPGPASLAATAPAPSQPNLAAPGSLAAPKPAVPAALRPDEGRILLRAKADTWISLRDRGNNQTLVSRLMKAGETLPVPQRDGLLLTAGFAPGLEFLVDGLPTPAFPAGVTVKRDIPMDPDRLRAGNYNPLAGTTTAEAQPSTPRPAAAPAPRPSRAPARPEDAAYEPPR